MTSKQFQHALKIAKSNIDLSKIDDRFLYGFALPDFNSVTASILAVAKTLRWQAIKLNGEVDNEALTDCRRWMLSKRIEIEEDENSLITAMVALQDAINQRTEENKRTILTHALNMVEAVQEMETIK